MLTLFALHLGSLLKLCTGHDNTLRGAKVAERLWSETHSPAWLGTLAGRLVRAERAGANQLRGYFVNAESLEDEEDLGIPEQLSSLGSDSAVLAVADQVVTAQRHASGKLLLDYYGLQPAATRATLVHQRQLQLETMFASVVGAGMCHMPDALTVPVGLNGLGIVQLAQASELLLARSATGELFYRHFAVESANRLADADLWHPCLSIPDPVRVCEKQ